MGQTVTLHDYVKSELLKAGHNEFMDESGKLIFFDRSKQIVNKLIQYDSDVQAVMDDLFTLTVLDDPAHDQHFKRVFLTRFMHRQIKRQTIEAFQALLVSTVLTHQPYIQSLYADLDKYVTQKQLSDNRTNQQNTQESDGQTSTDNRQAFSDLPGNTVNLDVTDTVMASANDNTISRNSQTNKQESKGQTDTDSHSESIQYNLDTLMKSNGLLDRLLIQFDLACFKQSW